MEHVRTLFQNPVFVKHVRSRLRRQQLLPTVAGTVIVCLLVLWGANVANAMQNGWGFTWLLVVQGGILFLGGTSQVAASVALAKDTGILDFHRITPQPPAALALGFVLGGAVREWICYACTLPFTLFFLFSNTPGPGGMVLILVDTVVVALLYHTMAVIAGLVSAKPRNVNSGVVTLIMMLHWLFSPWITSSAGPGFLTIVPTARQALDMGGAQMSRTQFFGVPFPDFVLSLMHQIPLLAFAFIAAARKMRHERAFYYTKRQAVVFLGVVALMALGDSLGLQFPWDSTGESFGGAAAVITVTLGAVLLITTVTPGWREFANGVLRARKFGGDRAPLWSDHAANWAPMIVFCVILCLASLAAGIGASNGPAHTIAAGFIGACVVIYFASAKQAFDLMFRKNSPSFLALLLFVLWVVPLFVGMIANIANLGDATSSAILGLSPLAGIPMTAGTREAGFTAVTAASAGTSLVLAIAFVQLRQRAERRATQQALKLRE